MPKKFLLPFLLIFSIAALSACGGDPQEAAVAPTLAVFPTETPTTLPTETNTPLPTNTSTATNTPRPTQTATATATPTITPDVASTEYIETQSAIATQLAANNATSTALFAAGLVPTNTPTDAPIEAVEPTLYYTQDGGVRVRRCPFISDECSDIVPERPEAEAILVIAQTTGDTFRGSSLWYQVEINGVTGFIHGSLLGTEPPVPELLPDELTQTALAPPVLGTAVPTTVGGS